MAWFVLFVAGVLEAVWAVALDRSEGFTKLAPTLVFAVTLLISMGGLAYAMRELPLGTSYAVWVGIGASLTVAYSMLTGADAVTPLRMLFLAMIIGGVIGLKAIH